MILIAKWVLILIVVSWAAVLALPLLFIGLWVGAVVDMFVDDLGAKLRKKVKSDFERSRVQKKNPVCKTS
ncbi:hypothetical protein LCGC14_2719620 [marine sediment metagenome]|uniref:Uncharacterized protein n=1 Tax=marine sediment metagenome TaxID=412755 RepID=A0A0F8ZY25_9ZZZZ